MTERIVGHVWKPPYWFGRSTFHDLLEVRQGGTRHLVAWIKILGDEEIALCYINKTEEYDEFQFAMYTNTDVAAIKSEIMRAFQ